MYIVIILKGIQYKLHSNTLMEAKIFVVIKVLPLEDLIYSSLTSNNDHVAAHRVNMVVSQ
jgi:hypothetical protein